MMPRWHHSDSSKAMSTEHDSVKKKTLELNSRSILFSAGLYGAKEKSCNFTTFIRLVNTTTGIIIKMGPNRLNIEKMNLNR